MAWLAQGTPGTYFLPSISPSLQTFRLTWNLPLGPISVTGGLANCLCPWHQMPSCTFPEASLLSHVWARCCVLCLFLCIYLACGSCTTLFCPHFISKIFFAIVLAFWGLAPSNSGSFWYPWCSWRKWCSQMPGQKQMKLRACLGNFWSVPLNIINTIKAIVETFNFYFLTAERCIILTWWTNPFISFVSLKWQKPPG